MVMSINTDRVKTHTHKKKKSAPAFPLDSFFSGTLLATTVFPPRFAIKIFSRFSYERMQTEYSATLWFTLISSLIIWLEDHIRKWH